MRNAALILVIFLATAAGIRSQDFKVSGGSGDFGITGMLNFVSSASIQVNPNSSNVIERNTFIDVNGGYGYGFTIKKKLFRDDLSFSISTEYVKINDSEQIQLLENDEGFARARATESLWMVPLEISGNFILPQLAENLKVYLGGGVGVYFGDRKRKFLGLETETISKNSMLNLHILSGMEYSFNRNISSVFEVKFREGEYRVESSFPTDNIVIDGARYFFQKDYNSKIFIDGLKVSLGLCYYFK